MKNQFFKLTSILLQYNKITQFNNSTFFICKKSDIFYDLKLDEYIFNSNIKSRSVICFYNLNLNMCY